MPFVLPRQQITDWKKGISRLQGFEHLPLREVGACLMCCSSRHCSTVSFRSALAGSLGPSFHWPNFLLPFGHQLRSQGWPRVWLRHADVKTVEGSPPSLASTSNTCFVCRQTPAKVGRRAGRLIGTARSLVDLRSIYCPWCSFFWAAGLWQTSGQDLWHMLYLASCFGSCEDQGTVSELLPGPHCWACVRRHPLHPVMHFAVQILCSQSIAVHITGGSLLLSSVLLARSPSVSFCRCLLLLNKIGPWKDHVVRDWVNPRSLCALLYVILLPGLLCAAG